MKADFLVSPGGGGAGPPGAARPAAGGSCPRVRLRSAGAAGKLDGKSWRGCGLPRFLRGHPPPPRCTIPAAQSPRDSHPALNGPPGFPASQRASVASPPGPQAPSEPRPPAPGWRQVAATGWALLRGTPSGSASLGFRGEADVCPGGKWGEAVLETRPGALQESALTRGCGHRINKRMPACMAAASRRLSVDQASFR